MSLKEAGAVNTDPMLMNDPYPRSEDIHTLFTPEGEDEPTDPQEDT